MENNKTQKHQEQNQQQNDETVTIYKKRHNELLNCEKFLNCLEGAGVDNWDGYDYALEMMEDE